MGMIGDVGVAGGGGDGLIIGERMDDEGVVYESTEGRTGVERELSDEVELRFVMMPRTELTPRLALSSSPAPPPRVMKVRRLRRLTDLSEGSVPEAGWTARLPVAWAAASSEARSSALVRCGEGRPGIEMVESVALRGTKERRRRFSW